MSLLDVRDTIAAIASPPGGGLRSIVRISGPGAAACMRRCFQADGRAAAAPDRPTVVSGRLVLPPPIPPAACLAYWWPAGRSYTGQPAAEWHLDGSPPLTEAALESACRAGARLARPGEFTLRAFLAGRLDLPQAEAVLAATQAADQRELDAALQQLAGGLSRPLHQLRDQLLDALAGLEAELDFADDEDVQFVCRETLGRTLQAARDEVRRLLGRMAARQRSDEAQLPRVVLVGPPNAGKSSLLNALAGRRAAIEADQPGATRDWVAAMLRLNDLACVLVDTAGAADHDAADPLDPLTAAARRAAAAAARQAALKLLCLDATQPLGDAQRRQLDQPDPQRLLVWTKTDLAPPPSTQVDAVATSSRTGAGLDQLRAELARRLRAARLPGDVDQPVVAATAARCRESLRGAARALAHAQRLLQTGQGEELVAAQLRHALDRLGEVVGAVYTDDVLDRIFSRFCIGK